MTYIPYDVPISCKGIVFENGRVWIRQNERGEWELPGGKLDPGEQPEDTVTLTDIDSLNMPDFYKQAINAVANGDINHVVKEVQQ